MGTRTVGKAVGAEQALVGSYVVSDLPTPYAARAETDVLGWGGVEQS